MRHSHLHCPTNNRCYVRTSPHYADTLDCLVHFFLLLPPPTEAHVRYNLVLVPCTIRSGLVSVYDINLRATHTKILSIRGVMIPIYLVSSATDSIRQRIVLFKPVPIPTSDPKSEFLCQSSLQLHRTYRPPEHLVRLGYLPRLRHHVSSILS